MEVIENNVLEKTLQIMAKTEFYYQWMIKYFTPYMGKRILEVGCGVGNATKLLKHITYLHSIDISENNIEVVKRYLGSWKNLVFEKMDVFDDRFIELRRLDFDTILSISVLEHIEDDCEVLKRFYHVLKPGGNLLLFVPALQFLYSSIDRELGHYRRYEKIEIIRKLEKSGFSHVKSSFFNFLGIFGWILNGKILQKKILPDSQIALFDKLVPFIQSIEKIIPPPVGACLICIAHKEV